MKISKTALMVLGVGIFIIAGVALYLAYAQYASQRDAIQVTIDAANQKYSQVTSDKRALEPQLTQLQQKTQDLKSAFNAANGNFPNVTIQSIEYDEEFSNLADDAGVTVQSLTATDDGKALFARLEVLHDSL